MIKKYFVLCFLILYSQTALPILHEIGYLTSAASLFFAACSEKKMYQIAGLGLYSILAFEMISYDRSKYDRFEKGSWYIITSYNRLRDAIADFNTPGLEGYQVNANKKKITVRIKEFLRAVNQNHPDAIEGSQEQEELQDTMWDRLELIDNTSFVFFDRDQEVLNIKTCKDDAINLLREPMQRYGDQYNKTIFVFGLTLAAGLIKKMWPY